MTAVHSLPLLALASALAAAPLPVPTPRDDVVEIIQGQRIADPYRWLENAADPRVRAWSDQENALTRRYIDGLPYRREVGDELMHLAQAASPAYSGLQARGPYVFATYFDPAHEQQPVIVTLNAAADPASRHVVLDLNAADPSGHTEFDWYVPSPDGSRVAVSISRDGSEAGTLHVYRTADGREVGDVIPHVQYPTAGGSVAWNRAGTGFWYTRYPGDNAPAADRRAFVQVYFHPLGSDWRDDPLIAGKAQGLERISEAFLDNRCGLGQVMMMVQRGDGNTWAYYILQENKPPIQIGTYGDGVVYATLGPDGAVYAISRAGTSNGKILKLEPPFSHLGLRQAEVLVPPSDVAIISGGAGLGVPDLDFDPAHVFVHDIIGGPVQVRIFDLSGRPQGKLPLPSVADSKEIAALKDGTVLFDVSTYLRPRYYAAWNPATGQTHETALRSESPVRFDDAEVRREFATSRDGTRIPFSLILKRGTVRNGRNPLLLTGYGGFGISMTPRFAGSFARLWLDAGGIFAVANIRGGSEYGDRWHREGMLTHKQNDFDDFAAVARHLIARGYTSSAKLAFRGGSNGGLLMGAVVTQHPTLARAVVSEVGIYDMIRNELDANGAFNVAEYGSVKNPAQFRALYAYSPYQHVVDGTPYPAMFFSTGATDGRVNPWQSRKMVAALQAATSSGYPIFLRTSQKSGHGHGSSLDEEVALQADILSFLFAQLGME